MSRKKSTWSDFWVGLFVLAALAILVVGSLWILGSSSFGGARASYQVTLKDSGGVQSGDRVRVAGVAVGRIESVSLRPAEEWPVWLAISIEPHIAIHDDASAAIANTGLMGSNYLAIVPGSQDRPLLSPGATIRGGGGGGLNAVLAEMDDITGRLTSTLDRAIGLLDQVTTNLEPIMTQLQAVLSVENVDNISAILTNTRSTLDEVSPRIGPLLERLDTLAATADEGLQDLPALNQQLSGLLDDLHSALGPEGERLVSLLDGAEGTLTTADEALVVFTANRGRIEAALRDLEQTMSNLKTFSERIKRQPSSILRSAPAPDRRPGQTEDGK